MIVRTQERKKGKRAVMKREKIKQKGEKGKERKTIKIKILN